MADIQLDGDPRRLGMAIYRAALEDYKQKYGEPTDSKDVVEKLEEKVPELAKQMVEALDSDVRDVYLMNSLEVLALGYAERDF